MANQHHLEYLQQGVDIWNQWRIDNSDIVPDLEGVNLEGTALEEINLEEANLTGANLKWANLWHACLHRGNLTQADLRMADLHMADLRGANLTHANLQGAILADADMREACLVNANFCGANMTGAKLYDSIREGWEIDGIVCDYIFLDANGSQSTPARRHFRSQEFERCVKHPLFENLFSNPLLHGLLGFFSFQSHETHSHT